MTDREELLLYRIFANAPLKRRIERAFKLIQNGLETLVEPGCRKLHQPKYSDYCLDRKIIGMLLESELLKEIVDNNGKEILISDQVKMLEKDVKYYKELYEKEIYNKELKG